MAAKSGCALHSQPLQVDFAAFFVVLQADAGTLRRLRKIFLVQLELVKVADPAKTNWILCWFDRFAISFLQRGP